jgi:hypothetical protein
MFWKLRKYVGKELRKMTLRLPLLIK